MANLTPLESLLRRDRWLVGGALAAVTALCWAWLVPMGRDMYGPMTGASAWMMTGTWDFTHLVMLFAMWVVMMAGMMLLFVGGVMNLWWIVAITVFVLLEKLVPFGAQGGRLSGLLLAGMGVWTLAG